MVGKTTTNATPTPVAFRLTVDAPRTQYLHFHLFLHQNVATQFHYRPNPIHSVYIVGTMQNARHLPHTILRVATSII